MRHALAKALYHEEYKRVSNDSSLKYEDINRIPWPKDFLNPLLTVRQDLGAGSAYPMDWNGKMITVVGVGGDANIYDYTIAIDPIFNPFES